MSSISGLKTNSPPRIVETQKQEILQIKLVYEVQLHSWISKTVIK